MASAPYRIIDRRSASGYTNSNLLIEAATQSSDRIAAPQVDYDIHRTVSNLGRRTLMNLGRALFWRFPVLQGVVLEQANVAVNTFVPQYAGRNAAWGKQTEDVLNNWHKIMDIAGWPYDWDSYLQGLVIAPMMDGEVHTLLTETPDGYPMVQSIPAHRVGSRYTNNLLAIVKYEGTNLWIDGVLVDDSRPYAVEGSPESGVQEQNNTREANSLACPKSRTIEFEARLIDGVIVDDYSRAIAYRVYTDNYASATFQDIPARNMFPAFRPVVPGQVRGFSELATAAFPMQDVHELGSLELLALKTFATQTIVETNETGDQDSAKAIIKTAATYDDAGNKTGLDVQKLEGGTIRYLKANSGSKLEAFEHDRPGSNTQSFMDMKLRDAFKGTEWDFFFSLDPQKIGGAPMRVVVEKINLVAAKRRKLVKKCCMRVDGYAICKFMKLGIIPWNDDWFMWDYQGPGEITADKKYDSDVALSEIAQGIGTRKLECARRGLDDQAVDAQRELEADSDLTRAGRLAAKHKITIQEALVILRPPTPNQQLPQPQQDPQQSYEGTKPATD